MTPAAVAAEYLALTLPSDAGQVAELVGLPVATVARLRAEATAVEVADRRAALDQATRSLCVWTCRACGEVGPYSPGLDHWWAHWRAAHQRDDRRRIERAAARRPKPAPRTVMVRHCRVPDCTVPAHARGLCERHYTRLLRTGHTDDPASVRPMVAVPALPHGACRTEGADFFPDREDGPEAAYAISLCQACPERDACAEYAIAAGEQGIWGGLRTDERAAIRTDRRDTSTHREAVPA